MKKILHITYSRKFGGAENLICNIIENTSDMYEHIYLTQKGDVSRILEKRNIKYIEVEKVTPKIIKGIIKNEKINLVHAHDFNASIRAAIIKCVPVISHIHQNPKWLKTFNFKSLVYCFFCFKFNKVIIVTKETLNSKINLFRKKIIIVNNFINNKKVIELSNEYNIDKKYDLIWIGRLVDIKDPEKFLNIVNEIVKENKNINAAIVGDGEMKEELKRRIKELKIEENVSLEGFRENPFPYIKNSSILLITSKSEGLPMVALEAMTLGKPILATNLPSLKEFINEKNGVICKSINEFKTNVLKLINNEELYKQLSEGSIKSIESSYNMNRSLKDIKKIYKELLN